MTADAQQSGLALGDVVVAISAFRSDEAVIALLDRMFATAEVPFAEVIVVDSLGTGAIGRTIAERNWPARYENADRNLGSAGNLQRRLELAAATGAGWCFTVNHDGEVDQQKIARLRMHGEAGDRVGAVYPELRYSKREGVADAPRRSFAPTAAFVDKMEAAGCITVNWSSSNCALYRLDAVREGAEVWGDLWMGFEDLAFGWSLHDGGWVQLLCPDVTVEDHYEYRQVRVLGTSAYIPDKPDWYPYYLTRNLITIARRTSRQAIGLGTLARRVLREVGVTVLFRKEKMKRLKFLWWGARDGLAGLRGKGPVP